MNSGASYEPTPLEQAYGLYLAQQIFGIPPINANTGVHIPGRNAVPFLTQSGVDRTILRTLWTVADPLNVGSLSSIQQFHLLLRLVAMTQAYMIHIDHTIEDVASLVQKHATRPLSLPHFNGVMIPQPQDSLLTMYGQFLTRTSLLGIITTTTSIDDAFGGLVEVQDVPLGGLDSIPLTASNGATTLAPLEQPLQPPAPSGIVEHRISQVSHMSSLSDASFGVGATAAATPDDGFSDFGTSNNAPLPTLGSASGSMGSSESLSGAVLGGGAVETASMSSQSGPVTATTFASTAVMSDMSAMSNTMMGGFVPTPVPQEPQYQQSMTTTVTEAITEDDDFGGFSSAQTTASQLPAPSLIEHATIDATSSMMSAGSVNTHSTMDNSDAFGEVGLQDAPLPSLDSFGAAPAPTPTVPGDDFGGFSVSLNAPTVSNTAAAVSDDEDDFGDFGSATQPSMSGESTSQVSGIPMMQPQESVQIPFVTDMGRAMSEPIASTPAVTDTGRSMSAVTDVFGDLGPAQDAPLPSLDVFGSAIPAMDNVTNQTENDEDDFGGFENAAPTTQDGDGFGSFADSLPDPTPTSVIFDAIEGSVPAPSSEDDDFGDFGGAAPEPASATSQSNDFMSFDSTTNTPSVTDMGRTMSEPTGSSIPQTSSINAAGRSLSIDDAFSKIADARDAPLPSLDMIGSSSMPDSVELTSSLGQNDNVDFGGFEQATEIGFVPEQPQSIDGDVANTRGLGPNFTSSEDGWAGEEKFGDFGGSAVTNEINTQPSVTDVGRALSEPVYSLSASVPDTNIGRSLSIDDAFGDMSAPENALLPSLELLGAHSTTAIETSADDTDAFGDFDQVKEAPSEAIGVMPPVNPTSIEPINNTVGFENLSAIFTSIEAPTQTNPMFEPPAVTDVGRTQSEPYISPPSGIVEEGRSMSISDAFGAPTQDNPLPSLDAFGSLPSQDNPSPLLDTFGTPEVLTSTPSHDDEDDDFGDFEEAKSTDEEDGFGDFETSNQSGGAHDFGSFDIANTALPGVSIQEQDYFVSFDDTEKPESQESAASIPVSNPPDPASGPVDVSAPQTDLFGGFESSEAEEVAHETNADDFGSFASSTIPNAPPLVDMEQTESADEFGDLGSTNDLPVANAAASENMEDDFGALGSADQPVSTMLALNLDFNDNKILFESTDQQTIGTSQEVPAATSDQFAEFENPTDRIPVDSTTAEETEDDFGDFDSAAFSNPPEMLTQSQPPTCDPSPAGLSDDVRSEEETDDDFGDFTAVETPRATTSATADDSFGDFGDFSSFEQAPVTSETSATLSAVESTSKSLESGKDNEDDDWGDFENVPSPTMTETITDEMRLQDRIRALSLQLPESFLLKAGRSGEHVDLGESFEVNFGVKSSLDDRQNHRVERCIQILESLTRCNAKLASTYWGQVFNVINDEMNVAQTVLNDAKALSPSDFKKVEKPLSTMMAGLCEYMRVTRSIVASIGDLLLLDESAILTVDTLTSTWGSLTILDKALEIEKKWKHIANLTSGTSLKADAVSLADIRSKAMKMPKDASSKLCELTLQRLSQTDRSTTQAEVSYQGKCFMACSANFLANRCPFYVVANGS